jgi:hypothetical protein
MARKPRSLTPRPPAGSYGNRLPTSPSPKKTAYPESIRFILQGRHSLKELRDMLRDAVNKLEAMGVTHISGGNLYFPPTDAAGNPVRAHETKITMNGPYPVAAEEYKAP